MVWGVVVYVLIFLHLELHGLVRYGKVRYGVACCCAVKYSPNGGGIDERGVILTIPTPSLSLYTIHPVYAMCIYPNTLRMSIKCIMEVILTIPPATHAFDLCSRYSIDQSQIVAGPDPSTGGGGLSLNREQNGLESY